MIQEQKDFFPVKIWPNMIDIVDPRIQYLLDHHEQVVKIKTGRRFSGRPIVYYPKSKKIRIEWLGTYNNIDLAVEDVYNILEENKKVMIEN